MTKIVQRMILAGNELSASSPNSRRGFAICGSHLYSVLSRSLYRAGMHLGCCGSPSRFCSHLRARRWQQWCSCYLHTCARGHFLLALASLKQEAYLKRYLQPDEKYYCSRHTGSRCLRFMPTGSNVSKKPLAAEQTLSTCRLGTRIQQISLATIRPAQCDCWCIRIGETGRRVAGATADVHRRALLLLSHVLKGGRS